MLSFLQSLLTWLFSPSVFFIAMVTGLLGDATEDMVEQLASGKGENVDEEEVYKMAKVLSECGGLEAIFSRLGLLSGAWYGMKDRYDMLCRLNHARDFVRCHELVSAALKLLGYCGKLKVSVIGILFPSEHENPCSLHR